MASTFSGLNTALTSLYAQRRGLDVTGQNIANANTEGYTRQRVVMHSQNANLVPGVYATTDAIGSGVTVSSVERLRNDALDQRSRVEHANSAYLNTMSNGMALIEDVFAEPSDTALQARLQDMWDGWNAVANNPDKLAPKSALIEQSETVAASMRDAARALNNQFVSNREGLETYVGKVNSAAQSIAKLNHEIVQATAAGLQANELEDQRATQILELSRLTGATATARPNGSVNVFIGNSPLVSEFSTREIKIDGGRTLHALHTGNDVKMTWSDTGAEVKPGGTMGAMMELVYEDGPISGYAKRLDEVARSLMNTVSQRSGFSSDGTEYTYAPNDPSKPGFQMFSGTSALDIEVNITDPGKILVSSGNPTPANPAAVKVLNGARASELADLGESKTGADAVYQSLIGDLGVEAQSVIRRRDVQNAVTDQVDAARNAESGVNLDEEMTNLLTYQRGYEAASRVLTTIDSMLDQLINRTGLVGR